MTIMNRVLVIGSPGSGKTTFSVKLSEITELPLVHLDKLFWKEGWTERSKEEFDALLDEVMKSESWIIDGNYSRTLRKRLEKADTVIYFDLPTRICLFRVIKRVITNRGKTRADMGDGCPERFDLEFLKYVRNFKKTNRDKILNVLSVFSDKQIIIIKKGSELKKLYDTLRSDGTCR